MKYLRGIKDWEELKNEVIVGDCLEGMKMIPDKSIDLILTDPPYDEFTHKGGRFSASNKFGGLDFSALKNVDFIAELLRISKGWVIIFTTLEMLGRIQNEYVNNYVRGAVWDRINPSPQLSGDRPSQAVEAIAILHSIRKNMKWNGGGKAGIWRYSVEFNKKQHPTQKPIRLIHQLLSDFSIRENDLILDPFMGSWTTARACKDLGRDFIGFELEEDYCKIGEERLRQQNLF